MRDYHSLLVWKKADDIVRDVYRLTDELPRSELFGLVSQMRRAAVSVGSNIAEACGRVAWRDGARLLSVASGSASELEYQVELIGKLGLGAPQCDLLSRIGEVQKMLRALESRWRSRAQGD